MNYSKKFHLNKILTANIILILLSSHIFASTPALKTSAQNSNQFEGNGADTPEKAVSNYLMALKNADYNELIKCYAVESLAENFNMEKYVNRYKILTPAMMMVSTDNEIMKQIAIHEFVSQIIKIIKYQMWNLGGSDFFLEATPIQTYDDSASIIEKTFPKDLDKKLKTLTFNNEFYKPNNLLEYDEVSNNIKNYQNIVKDIYGASDVKDVIAKFTVDGTDYYFMTETIKYKGKWYISLNTSITAATFGLSIQAACMVKASDLN